MNIRALLPLACALAIAGCAGGSAPVPTMSGLPQTSSSSLPSQNTSETTYTVIVPRSSKTVGSIQFGVISVNGAAPSTAVPVVVAPLSTGTHGCTTSSTALTCVVAGNAPVGNDVLSVSAYQSSSPVGTPLAVNAIAQQINAGVVNNLSFALGGTPASVTLNGPFVAPDDGNTHTFGLSVTAQDANGDTIIAPGAYSAPIALAISGDPNGSLQLSTTQVSAPATNAANGVTVTYDAAKALISGTITATAGGATPVTTNVDPIVYSPTSLATLLLGGNSGSVTVSEAQYGGAFTLGNATPYATVTCNPTNCTPSVVGGSVTLSVAPASVGTATLSVTDAHAVSASIALTVNSSSSVTVPVPAPPVITEFTSGISGGAKPYGIATGSDGNLWFTESSGSRIGRITTAGAVTEFPTVDGTEDDPLGIASGPDGNLWFAEFVQNSIGRITTAGSASGFSTGISSGAGPEGIMSGPDGTLWFTESPGGRIGHITTSGVVTEFSTGISSEPTSITAGPDGNIWFTECTGNRIGTITTSGAVTEFSTGISAGAGPSGIAAGPDGNLWFAENKGNRIARITTSGLVTEYTTGLTTNAGPSGITSGPDGNIWFTETTGSRIGRITLTGTINEFTRGLTGGSAPQGITTGPDGNLWFTECLGNAVGRITP